MADKKIIDLERLQQFLSKCDARYIRFGKKVYDGTLGAGTSDLAGNFEPYSDDSGAFQSKPMISQGTGTDNNTAIVTTGNFAQLREKQGNTLVVNQIFKNTNVNEQTVSGLTISRASDSKKIHIVGTSTAIVGITIYALGTNVGHKYFVRTFSNKFYALFFGQTGIQSNAGVITPATNSALVAYIAEGTTFDEDVEFDILDITSWPADVISDLTAHPDHFFWYYNGSLVYNAGSLENANGVKLVCTGRNLLDPSKFTEGKSIASDGTLSTDANWAVSDYFIVPPNTSIYFRKVASSSARIAIAWYDANQGFINTTSIYDASDLASDYRSSPSNAIYARVCTKKTSVSECCVSLYYTTAEGGEDYGQYYEYKEPTVIDTGSEVIRSAGSVRDSKAPDGKIARNIGSTTSIRTKNYWAYGAGAEGNLFYSMLSVLGISANGNNLIMLPYTLSNAGANNMNSGECCIEGGYLYVRDDSLNGDLDALANKFSNSVLQYALAEPTTEQGTPFPENVEIDDYGMMYWLDGNDNLVGIPQGAKFFYPFNYAGSLDDLYHYVRGNMQKIIRTYSTNAEELTDNPDVNKNWDTAPTQGSVKPVTSGGTFEADRQLKDALGGTLRQVLAATKSIGFANTSYVDLGDLDWTYDGANQVFFASISNLKPNPYTNPNLLSSLYETQPVGIASMTNMSIRYVGDSSSIYVKNTAYTAPSTFKAAMKGVLLAYEKAE